MYQLYHDGSGLTTENIAGDNTKPVITVNEIQGLMLDNNGEYRYYGANPNNYVLFNGELWRMISLSKVKTNSSDQFESFRVKIIRNESLGNYSWDSSLSSINSGYGVNHWGLADLNLELNTLYYSKNVGTCYSGESNASTTCDFTTSGLSLEAGNMLEDAVWYLGGSSDITNMYANDYYDFERGTTVYDCSTDDGGCPRPITWVGKVGLMYPSDYVYATDQSLCSASAFNWYQDENVSCVTNDWLYFSTTQWTISPYSGYEAYAFRVGGNGNIGYSYVYDTVTIRPTVILKTDIIILSGDGSESSPYVLSLK